MNSAEIREWEATWDYLKGECVLMIVKTGPKRRIVKKEPVEGPETKRYSAFGTTLSTTQKLRPRVRMTLKCGHVVTRPGGDSQDAENAYCE